jgi:putative membrane protein
MKINLTPITKFAVAAAAVCIAATGLAQNPRHVPAVPGATPDPATASGKTTSKQGGGSLSAKDRDFMKKAAEGGMMEVEMGRMAEQQGKSAEVKAFGKRMVADHSKANSELMALASRKGVQLSNRAPKMEKMGGADFDKKYVADMVKDHEKDLAEFQGEAQGGTDADVKAFAAKGAKMVQKHLELAKADQAKVK